MLTLVLAGCSSGSNGQKDSPGDASVSDNTSPSTSQSEIAIPSPKDVTAVDVCGLMPGDAASKLGLGPDGEKDEGGSSASSACVWENSESYKSVSLSPILDRSLSVYYENTSEFVDFKKLKILENPGVRANKSKPMESGSCSVYVATRQNQLVNSFATVPVNEIGKSDPCVPAKKALELSLPSWPAAK
ncbi:DUF3558 domain-containing protein [Actinopolyspora alba]|uniref:DUF3558 domain-containing protein n=1 Tax=Actinopolyspora alba TaxID=673379 RepID=UPI001FE1F98C|nr:DUF3558 domain-containing protein [Actinopolyspora alba]